MGRYKHLLLPACIWLLLFCLPVSAFGVDKVTLQAEFHRPGVHEDEMLVQFRRTTMTLLPEAPERLLNAIARQEAWRGGAWRLARLPHTEGAGHDLRLWNR